MVNEEKKRNKIRDLLRRSTRRDDTKNRSRQRENGDYWGFPLAIVLLSNKGL